jgi:hypothetical protein
LKLALEALCIHKVGAGSRNRVIGHRQVRHRVVGIKDGSKMVVRKSDLGQ